MISLQGKTVLVTRPHHQAEATIATLKLQGACVLHMPLIEIADPSDHFASLDRAIARLSDYAWVVFTSANAVRRFFARPGALASDECSPRVAAVGKATAALLQDLGMTDLVIAKEPHTLGLLEALSVFEFEGKRVLFPRARAGRDEIPKGLQERGAMVDVVEAYQTILPHDFNPGRFRSLFDEKKIDIVHMASPTAVGYFFEHVVTQEFLRSKIPQLCFMAIGPTTEAALHQRGVRFILPAPG